MYLSGRLSALDSFKWLDTLTELTEHDQRKRWKAVEGKSLLDH